jgi:hypothetical protein
VAQGVEHLLCKSEALNLNPSPTKNKQKTLSDVKTEEKFSLGCHMKTQEILVDYQ